MKLLRLVVLAGFVTAIAGVAAAQTPAAPERWASWMGCWQVSDESVQDAAALLAQLTGTAAPASTRPGALVCVTPAERGATMTTIVNNEPVNVETVVADGSQRPLADANCNGWQRNDWSAHGPRVYGKAHITCGDRPARTVSGFSAIVAGTRWIDIQMVESEGRKSLRVRSYRRAANQEHARAPLPSAMREFATMPLGARLSLAEIKEAATHLPEEMMHAAVLELGQGGYELNAKRLLDLDSAGVPDSVIDLMVAMSFPKKFVVERAVATGGGSGIFGDDFSASWTPFAMWPYHYSWWGYDSPFQYPYYYSARYSPFGFGYWGYYDPYYYRGPGVIIIEPGTGTIDRVEPSGDGRVVDGRGYTRIRRNEPEPARRISDGNGGWTTASGSSGGSGSSGVSSSGYSGGGAPSGGGEGTRTAVPRPPGQ